MVGAARFERATFWSRIISRMKRHFNGLFCELLPLDVRKGYVETDWRGCWSWLGLMEAVSACFVSTVLARGSFPCPNT